LIDLHCHTSFSDGSLDPAALLDHAAKAGVDVLAVTDHDNVQAHSVMCEEASARGIALLCGVELSTHLEGCERSVHLLGYFPGQPQTGFCEWLLELQQGRNKRNRELLRKLQDLGFDIQWEEVSALAKRQIGRPHFAQLMQRKGYVSTLKEAFTRYLGEDGLAWVEREEPSLAAALEQLKGAGALTSLAHPVRISRDWSYINRIVAEYAGRGLEAVECFHSEHCDEDERRLLALAERYALGVTGGSDFHGDAKPEVELGTGRARNVRVPDFVAEQLWRRFPEIRSSLPVRISRALQSDSGCQPR
jgi:hypothetical protein